MRQSIQEWNKQNLWKAAFKKNFKSFLKVIFHKFYLAHFWILSYKWKCTRIFRSNTKTLGFRWSKKAKIMLEIISFWQNISLSIFRFFSIFIYNESLPMKSYQFFKICKRFDKERGKTLMQQSMSKEKQRKFGLFYIRLLYKVV